MTIDFMIMQQKSSGISSEITNVKSKINISGHTKQKLLLITSQN